MRTQRAAAGAAALTLLALCPTTLALPGSGVLQARAECKAYKIQSGDSCWKIAEERCSPKISTSDLYKFNSGLEAKCSNLKLGDPVCCTAGTMPDMDPPGNSDGTCKTLKVVDGDDCWKFATQRCQPAIEPAQLYKFNGGSDEFCKTLAAGKALCCTKGTKPDLRPKKNADGSCFWVSVPDGQGCNALTGPYDLTTEDLDKFNIGKTWGWQGCELLQKKQRVCLSDGTPPLPEPITEKQLQCGPQVQGTVAPTNGTKIADLNPCPLNACCSGHGFCGVTPEFCIDTSIKNTPGTKKNGTNGCISNCGLDVVNNKNPPASFLKVGYFESWNPYTRPCLTMDVNDISKLGGYTHIHFSFANLTEDFVPSVTGVQDQWDKFVKLQGVKRIVAFGGWAFSNDPGTNHIIRRGVMPANRQKFVENLVNFVKNSGIDGIDFDWEYPGATDIIGSDPGLPEDGANYLETIKSVKRRLPDKSVSFAAPASFWYLKNFLIKEMAAVADYIVYMTYDLHGQWDVGNRFAVEGCEAGNCLRSHVNRTETMYSLAMVTKAGVPANKVMVGVSSYGRSFKMAKPGCKGPTCTFLGEKNKSPAMKGECTREGGYLGDAEIRATKKSSEWFGEGYESYYDKESDSDIVIYNGDEWVAFMDHETKKRRTEEYRKLGFLGTTDWAIDLQQDFNADSLYSGDGGQINDVVVDLGPKRECVIDKHYNDLQALADDADGKDPWCLAAKTVDMLSGMMNTAFDGYDEAANGYDGLFPTYEKYMLDTLNGRIEEWLWDKDEKKAGWPYYKCYADKALSRANRANAWEYKCNDEPKSFLQDYTYWLEVSNKKGWEESLEAAGIDPAWIEGKEKERTVGREGCSSPTGNCLTTTWRWIGFPQRKEGIKIPDPKDVIDTARKNFTNVQKEFSVAYAELALGSFEGEPADAVDVLSIPVSMLRDAIDSMKEVKELAKKVQEENKKNLILKILEGILFLIPFVGGMVSGLGRLGAGIARIIALTEIAGSGALGIYTAVEDPDMAPVAILGMVMGALGVPSGAKYRTLGKAKRDMSPDMKANMGKSFKEINPKIETITSKMPKVCRR